MTRLHLPVFGRTDGITALEVELEFDDIELGGDLTVTIVGIQRASWERTEEEQ